VHACRSTFCREMVTREGWRRILNFIVHGSQSLQAYDEYKKVVIEDGVYKITDRRTAMHHRMQIGTIAGDSSLRVKYVSGGYIGTIEEFFIARLQPGDVFVFAGRKLELHRVKNMEVLVRPASDTKTNLHASWMGGRLALSAQMSALLRDELYKADSKASHEMRALQAVFRRQRKESIVPNASQFLIETFKSREGYHAIFYPFEG